MNVVIFSFYYCAVGVLLQGIVGKNNITTNTALGGISVSSWYIPHEGLIKNNKTPEICYDHNSKPLGLCITWSECINNNQGVPTDIICPDKYSICCIFNKYECDSWTKGNSMHITSPRYPQPFYDLGFSEIFLQKVTVVRLLRLDFIDFKMALPNSDTGVCETDRMVITNGDIQYVMCGPYTNQHFYYYANDSASDIIKVQFITSESNLTRAWKIKITEWPAQPYPKGCTQYFNESVGTFYTTDYMTNGRQLVNQNYTVCIKRELNKCWISYSPCYDQSFKVIREINLLKSVIRVTANHFPFGPRDRFGISDNDDTSLDRCIRYEQQQC